jgi:hypothetical protein
MNFYRLPFPLLASAAIVFAPLAAQAEPKSFVYKTVGELKIEAEISEGEVTEEYR